MERSSASTWATFRTMEASPPVGAAVLVLPEAAGVLFPPPQADREMAVAKARASASAFFMFGSSL